VAYGLLFHPYLQHPLAHVVHLNGALTQSLIINRDTTATITCEAFGDHTIHWKCHNWSSERKTNSVLLKSMLLT
jgi:hypothetical protein